MANTKIITSRGIPFHVRTEKYGDEAVIEEVVSGDCYRLYELSQSYTPSFVIDIGAHIGCFSLLANLFWPNVPIVAFEPNKRSYELLVENTKHLNIITLNKAVTYDKRPLLYADADAIATGGGFIATQDEFNQKAEKKTDADGFKYFISEEHVETCSLDEFLHADNILLKLDCEGTEHNIIRNIDRQLAKKVTHICGEYHLSLDTQDSVNTWEEFEALCREAFPHLTFTPRELAQIQAFWGRA